MNFKYLAKSILPKFITSLASNLRFLFRGNSENMFTRCNNWDEAVNGCKYTDNQEIIEKLRFSAGLVRDGKAAYERDTVIFPEIQINFSFQNALLQIAKCCNQLNIVDYGGSVGTTFRQNYQELLALGKKYFVANS